MGSSRWGRRGEGGEDKGNLLTWAGGGVLRAGGGAVNFVGGLFSKSASGVTGGYRAVREEGLVGAWRERRKTNSEGESTDKRVDKGKEKGKDKSKIKAGKERGGKGAGPGRYCPPRHRDSLYTLVS